MDAQFDMLTQLTKQNAASSKAMAAKMSGQDKINKYEDQMIQAQNKVNQSPGELKAAQKAYYEAKFGLDGYKDFKEGEAKKEIGPIIKVYSDNFSSTIKELRSYLDVLSSQDVYSSRMDDIKNNYVQQQRDLESKVRITRSKKNVDDRLANFYEKQIESNNDYIWALNKLYWGLIIALIASIIYNKQYKNIKTIIILISLILIIYIGKTIRRWINIDKIFRSGLEYLSQTLMYITFSIRVLLDKLF